jgi:hypothetical protein
LEIEFCTPWPEQLNSDEACNHYLPVEVTTYDYLNSTPSIRDSRARVVKFHVLIKLYFTIEFSFECFCLV